MRHQTDSLFQKSRSRMDGLYGQTRNVAIEQQRAGNEAARGLQGQPQFMLSPWLAHGGGSCPCTSSVLGQVWQRGWSRSGVPDPGFTAAFRPWLLCDHGHVF